MATATDSEIEAIEQAANEKGKFFEGFLKVVDQLGDSAGPILGQVFELENKKTGAETNEALLNQSQAQVQESNKTVQTLLWVAGGLVVVLGAALLLKRK